jgi:hypothetical protein
MLDDLPSFIACQATRCCAQGSGQLSRRYFQRGASTSSGVMTVRSPSFAAVTVAAILTSVIGFAQGVVSAPSEAHANPAYEASSYSGGDGRSIENAVVLRTRSEFVGVAAEYAWISHWYQGSKVLQQALTPWQNGKRYDVITIKTSARTHLTLWFDITSTYQ